MHACIDTSVLDAHVLGACPWKHNSMQQRGSPYLTQLTSVSLVCGLTAVATADAAPHIMDLVACPKHGHSDYTQWLKRN